MPAPSLDEATMRHAYFLVKEYGGVLPASKASGISQTTLRRQFFGAVERLGLPDISRPTGRTVAAASRQVDPAVATAMASVGTGLTPSSLWIKMPAKDGEPGYSALLRPQQETPEDLATRIAEAFQSMPAAKPVAAPGYHDADLITVYPLADVHIGMMAWGKETGEDYDTSIAAERVRTWIGRAVEASPASSEAVILDVGDLTHADDQTNQTPRSKHVLDVDTRHFRTLDVTIATLAYAVDYAVRRHAKVTVRILPGNHNPTTYMAVMFALAERYRNEPRVVVQKVPGEFWVHRFGKCLLAAHHGDKSRPERMVMFLADEYAEQWGLTRHRFLWTGHLHHHKSADIGGVQWEQLRAVTSRDAYAVAHAYSARSQLQAITLHKDRGEVQRVKVAA